MSEGLKFVIAILLGVLVIAGNAFVLATFRKKLRKLKERINR
jgi:hypothetical protein